MNNGLHPVSVTCPVCTSAFTAVNVEVSLYKPDHTDEDFCIHYNEINPLVYEPVICARCGYADFINTFGTVTEKEKKLCQSFYEKKFTDDPEKNPFELSEYYKCLYGFLDMLGSEGERGGQAGLEAFKMLLLNMEARNAPYLSQAKASLRMGWLYRMTGDPLEMKYLERAAEYFAKAFKEETFEEADMDSATCAYLVGELNRRINKSSVAMEWFETALNSASAENNTEIARKTREQMKL